MMNNTAVGGSRSFNAISLFPNLQEGSDPESGEAEEGDYEQELQAIRQMQHMLKTASGTS